MIFIFKISNLSPADFFRWVDCMFGNDDLSFTDLINMRDQLLIESEAFGDGDKVNRINLYSSSVIDE